MTDNRNLEQFAAAVGADVKQLTAHIGNLSALRTDTKTNTDDFAWTEYEQLAAAMGSMRGKMMVSLNDHPDIRRLFADYRMERLELAYCIARDKTQKASGELVICNY